MAQVIVARRGPLVVFQRGSDGAAKIVVGNDTANAARFAGNSASSATLSQEWAEGTEPGGPGTKSAKGWAEEAASSAALSQEFAATAEAAAGPTYASTAAGLAATASGEGFAVDNGDGTVTVYLNNAGVAVAQRTLGTTAYFSASAGASRVGFLQAGTGAVARTVQAKLRDIVSVKDFGAVGDGVTDDTAALVSALATGKDVMLDDGTYLLSPTAVQTIANQGYQRLYSNGNATLSINLASSIDLFAFNGPVALENLTIDFNNNFARYAFKWNANAGHVRITNVRVRNLKDIDSSTGSITFWIVPTGNSFEIDGIVGSSLLKRGNGTITDSAGSYNFIYVGGGSGSTKGSISNVFVSEIHNINSSDQIIYEDTSAIYVITDTSDAQNQIEINNIQGYNFGKRLLKIHASNVTVNNVNGVSPEGDSLGVIGFLSGDGVGDKYGNAASNVRAYGLMETAFSASAFNVKWRNVIASVQPGNKTGMLNAAFGFLVNGDGTNLDGFWSDSQRDIAIGTSSKIIKNTTLRNIHLVQNSAKAVGCSIHNTSSTLGFDGLLIDGLTATIDPNAANTAVVYLVDYLDGTTKKGRNLFIKNVTVQSNGPINSFFISTKYVENISISSCNYINTSGLSHFRLLSIENGSNVNIDDVMIEGANQIGVFVKDCTGRNTVGRVYNPNASTAAVYNNNSTNFWSYGCDQTKVSGQTTATPQYVKYTTGTTSSRPTTGLVAGFSQHFDTTLGKPIWWDGSVWKDATGATV